MTIPNLPHADAMARNWIRVNNSSKHLHLRMQLMSAIEDCARAGGPEFLARFHAEIVAAAEKRKAIQR